MSQCIDTMKTPRYGKPKWLRRKLPTGPEYEKIRKLVKDNDLHTVCSEAQCPNQFECYGRGTATFMILGDRCTRNCRFCAVSPNPVRPPDLEEPDRVAEAVKLLHLRYVVITSVTRDDLPDGGAFLFAETITAVRQKSPKSLIEVLIPDLQGNHQALAIIIDAAPDVLNHNIETVPRLYPQVRPQADYTRSLQLLAKVKELAPNMVTKSGLMVGLGETEEELKRSWLDLVDAGCDILSMGQYLQPSQEHLPVINFVEPEEFERLGKNALSVGFAGVASAPFVRSSYEAELLFKKAMQKKTKALPE